VGKYGPEKEMHSFEPKAVRRCVERSLRRLGTDYLDVVCEYRWAMWGEGEPTLIR
jgi:aryl-alcohol dehydrogenase-like predicted oxidoreductase